MLNRAIFVGFFRLNYYYIRPETSLHFSRTPALAKRYLFVFHRPWCNARSSVNPKKDNSKKRNTIVPRRIPGRMARRVYDQLFTIVPILVLLLGAMIKLSHIWIVTMYIILIFIITTKWKLYSHIIFYNM